MLVTLCPAGTVMAAEAESTQAVEEENDQAAGAENTQAVVVEQDEDTQLYGATAESNFSWDGDTITGYNGSSTKVVIPGRAKKLVIEHFLRRILCQ